MKVTWETNDLEVAGVRMVTSCGGRVQETAGRRETLAAPAGIVVALLCHTAASQGGVESI